MRRAILLALAATAWADGKFVSMKVPVVEIPDQQAIVVWKDGRERLVIDTAHGGEGDLAWIVPLPAPPRIEPVSPAVFRTLEVVTMPALEEEPSGLWPFALCLLAACAVISIFGQRPFAALIAVLFVAMGVSLFLVATMPRSDSVPGVTLLDRGRAGSYETATLEAVDAGALILWLRDNGFDVPAGVRSGIEEYVREGFVFAVARLKPGGLGGRAHPLSFEFEAKAPVYPMRLTGAQDRKLSLRLFVLSSRRARCGALATESCFKTGVADKGLRMGTGNEDDIRLIGQPDLLRIAGGASVLTTLTGDLAPSEMRSDLRIEFEDYEPVVPVLYTRDAARGEGADVAAWAALVLLLPCYLAAWTILERGKGWRHVLRAPVRVGRRGKVAAWCAAIGVGAGVGVLAYATSDIVETRGKSDVFGLAIAHKRTRYMIESAATGDLDAARAIAAPSWRGQINPYDGGPVREEPSPGNYGLEVRDGKVAYIFYDARGTPNPDDW